MSNPVTNAQLKAIHVFKRKHGLSDENYRAFLQSRCNVNSAKHLTRQQATSLLRYWNGQSDRPKQRSGRDERLPNELVTEEMSTKIQQLLVSLGFDEDTGKLEARGLIKKQCGQPWPQTRAQANKVIEGLKAMDRHGWRATRLAGEPDHQTQLSGGMDG